MATSVIGTLRLALGLGTAEYESAWDKAEAKTRGSVGNINRLVQGFSGQKLIAEADKVAAGLEKIGGVGKLTQAELAKVNTVIDSAVAKFRALGQDIPPNIAKVHAELKTLNTQAVTSSTGFGSLSSAMGLLRTALPIASLAGGVGLLTNMARSAFETASKVTDLANKTGLGTSAIQRMQAVADQTGTSLDAFTNAAFKLGVNVAEGTTKAKDAVKELGLSYDELRAKKPEEQFAAVVRALEQVDSQQERNRLGVALFGRQFSEIAASIEEGYSNIADAARVTGEAQIKALDQAADAWTRFKNDAAAATASFLGNLVLTLQAIERAGDALSATEKLKVFARDPFGYLTNLQKIGEELQRQEQFAASNKPMSAHGTSVATAALADYTKQLAKTGVEVAKLSDLESKATTLRSLSYTSLARSVRDSGEEISAAFEHQSQLQSRSIQEAVAAEKVALEWARANGAVLAPSIRDTGTAIEEADEKTIDWRYNLQTLSAAFADMAQVAEGSLGTTLGLLGRLVTSVNTAVAAVQSIKQGFDQFGKEGLGNKLQGGLGIITGTVGLISSVVNVFREWFGISKEIQAVREEVRGLQKDLNATATAAQRAEAEATGWMDKGALTFVQVRDALVSIGRSADEAGPLVEALWDTDHPDRARRAMEEINRVLKEQQAILARNTKEAGDLFDDLMDAARAYGGIPPHMQAAIDKLISLNLLTEEQVASLRELATVAGPTYDQINEAAGVFQARVDQLGASFQQQRIDQTAKKYVEAFDTLRRGVADLDLGAITADAREELSALVQDAIRNKAVLPAQLKEYVLELQRTGQLLDENGEAITDLSALKWGEAMKTEAEIAREGWERLLTRMEEFFDRLLGNLDKINNRPPTDLDFRINLPDLNFTQPVPMARGGIVPRPTLALIGEREPELVAPLRELPALMAGLAAHSPMQWNAPGIVVGQHGVKESRHDGDALRVLERINRTLEDFAHELPIVIRAAVQGAV